MLYATIIRWRARPRALFVSLTLFWYLDHHHRSKLSIYILCHPRVYCNIISIIMCVCACCDNLDTFDDQPQQQQQHHGVLTRHQHDHLIHDPGLTSPPRLHWPSSKWCDCRTTGRSMVTARVTSAPRPSTMNRSVYAGLLTTMHIQGNNKQYIDACMHTRVRSIIFGAMTTKIIKWGLHDVIWWW